MNKDIDIHKSDAKLIAFALNFLMANASDAEVNDMVVEHMNYPPGSLWIGKAAMLAEKIKRSAS